MRFVVPVIALASYDDLEQLTAMGRIAFLKRPEALLLVHRP